MAKTRLQCPSCNTTIASYQWFILQHKLGSPKVKCEKCSTVASTGKSLWKDLSSKDKAMYYLQYFLITMLFFLFPAFGLIFLVDYLFLDSQIGALKAGPEKTLIFVGAVLVFAVLNFILRFKYVKRRMQAIEENFNNGEFSGSKSDFFGGFQISRHF